MRHESRQSQGPTGQQASEPPALGGVRFGPTLAAALYVLLVGAAVLALWVRRAPGRLPAALADLSHWLFLAFAIIFAAYRFRLVLARKYPAGKAFFQVGAAALFFMFLLPQNQRPYTDQSQDDVVRFLESSDPRLRAMAAELAGYRSNPGRYASELVDLLTDPEPSVRSQAHSSLVRLRGEDLGSPSNPEAVKAWRSAYP